MCFCPIEFLSKQVSSFCERKILLVAKRGQCDCREVGMCRVDCSQDTSNLLGVHACWDWTLEWALQTLGMGKPSANSSCTSPIHGQSQDLHRRACSPQTSPVMPLILQMPLASIFIFLFKFVQLSMSQKIR